MGTSLKITQIKSRYVVQGSNGNTQIWTQAQLTRVLKQECGLDGLELIVVLASLTDDGFTNRTIQLPLQKAA